MLFVNEAEARLTRRVSAPRRRGAGLAAQHVVDAQEGVRRQGRGGSARGEGRESSAVRRRGVQQQNNGPAAATITRYIATAIRNMARRLRGRGPGAGRRTPALSIYPRAGGKNQPTLPARPDCRPNAVGSLG